MEARDGAAGDRDEQEGEEVAGPGRSGSVDEAGQRRHLHRRCDDRDADRQRRDRADLQEGRQIVAGREQQPDRQNRSDEAVTDQQPGQLFAVQREDRAPERIGRNLAAVGDRGHQQDEADDRDFTDPARPDEAQINAHQECDRNRRGDRESPPGRVGQRLDDDQREHGEDDHHDHEGAEQRDDSGDRAQLGLDQVAERAAVAAHRDEEHQEILDRAGEYHAGQYPQHAGQIAHLGGEHRTDQRAGAGDRGEVVTVEHVFVGRNVVQAVVELPGRSHPLRIDSGDLVRDEERVIAVADQIDRDRRDDDPQGVDGLSAGERDDGQGDGGEYCDSRPGKVRQDAFHCFLQHDPGAPDPGFIDDAADLYDLVSDVNKLN